MGLIAMRLESKPTVPTTADDPVAELVNLDSLSEYLPADTPTFNQDDRDLQLKKRQDSVRERYINW